MGHFILDGDTKEVKAVGLLEWAAWFEDNDNRRVALEDNGNYRVSTVFLGIEHHGGMFETMVFQGGFSEVDMERAETYEGALKNHKEMCEKWLK